LELSGGVSPTFKKKAVAICKQYTMDARGTSKMLGDQLVGGRGISLRRALTSLRKDYPNIYIRNVKWMHADFWKC